MSKVAVIGISGRVGSRVAAELLRRSHSVTGIARDVSAVPARPGLSVQAADASRLGALAPVLTGHDAVISAMRFAGADLHRQARRRQTRAGRHAGQEPHLHGRLRHRVGR